MKMREALTAGVVAVAATACIPKNIVIPPTEQNSGMIIGVVICADKFVHGWKKLTEDERKVTLAVRAEAAVVLLCCGLQVDPETHASVLHPIPSQEEFTAGIYEEDGTDCISVGPAGGTCENISCLPPGQQPELTKAKVLEMLNRID